MAARRRRGAQHRPWAPNRCRTCGAEVMWLTHEGTGKPRAFDPWREVPDDSVDAAGFAWWADSASGKDLYRVLTVGVEFTRPFDPRVEMHARPHSLTCGQPPAADQSPHLSSAAA